jgi:hypothetical protein
MAWVVNNIQLMKGKRQLEKKIVLARMDQLMSL